MDLHETLTSHIHDGCVNRKLIDALIEAQKLGIIVCLWTGGTWNETVEGVELMKEYGLEFADVFPNVLKPTGLIIDNLSVSPEV